MKNNSIKNGNDLNGFKLSLASDGESFRKGDSTAYIGVGQADPARHSQYGEYAALIQLDSREQKLAGKGATSVCWHLSGHSTILEAAYAVSVFNADRDNNLESLNGVASLAWKGYGIVPAFAYAAIDTEDHIAYRDGLRAAALHRAAAKAASKKAAQEADHTMVNTKAGRAKITRLYCAEPFRALGRIYGNATVGNDLKHLTVNEFINRYDIQSKAA